MNFSDDVMWCEAVHWCASCKPAVELDVNKVCEPRGRGSVTKLQVGVETA